MAAGARRAGGAPPGRAWGGALGFQEGQGGSAQHGKRRGPSQDPGVPQGGEQRSAGGGRGDGGKAEDHGRLLLGTAAAAAGISAVPGGPDPPTGRVMAT